MSRSCVCDGGNENCRFCGGTGMIADRLGAALQETVQRLELQNTPTEGIKFPPTRRSRATSLKAKPVVNRIQCPKGCGKWVNPRKLTHHLNRFHTNPATACDQATVPAPGRPIVPKPERKYEVCQVCGATVRVERIKRHILKAHKSHQVGIPTTEGRGTAFGPQAAEPLRMRTSRKVEGEYRICSICKARVRTSRIGKHMAKVHRRKKQNPRPTLVSSPKDPLREKTSFAAPRDKNLDSTKPYAHAYREQGRYGSHPSHDGFDDESCPD